MNTDSKTEETKQCTIPRVIGSNGLKQKETMEL